MGQKLLNPHLKQLAPWSLHESQIRSQSQEIDGLIGGLCMWGCGSFGYRSVVLESGISIGNELVVRISPSTRANYCPNHYCFSTSGKGRLSHAPVSKDFCISPRVRA